MAFRKTKTDENDFEALDRLAHGIAPEKLRALTAEQRARWEAAKLGRPKKGAGHQSRADTHQRRAKAAATGRRLREEGRCQPVPTLFGRAPRADRADGIIPRGQRALVGCEDGTLRIFDVKSGAPR